MFIAHFPALASYVTVVNYERKVFTRLASDITFSTSFSKIMAWACNIKLFTVVVYSLSLKIPSTLV